MREGGDAKARRWGGGRGGCGRTVCSIYVCSSTWIRLLFTRSVRPVADGHVRAPLEEEQQMLEEGGGDEEERGENIPSKWSSRTGNSDSQRWRMLSDSN